MIKSKRRARVLLLLFYGNNGTVIGGRLQSRFGAAGQDWGFRSVIGAFGAGLGLRGLPVNATDCSKFIVRPMTATLIRDGVAIGLQFIKNVR